MIDFLRKTVLAGVGATVVTAEKVESILNDLVERGQLSAEEARKATEEITSQSKREFEEAEKRLGSMFEDLLHKAHVASQEDVAKLTKRVNALELKVASLEKEASEAGGTEASK